MVKNGRELRSGDLVVGEYYMGTFYAYGAVFLIVKVFDYRSSFSGLLSCVVHRNRNMSDVFSWPFDRDYKAF